MKNRLTGLFTLALCTLILTGCAKFDYESEFDKTLAALNSGASPLSFPYHFPTPTPKRFKRSLKTWDGAYSSELMASWGQPSHITEEPIDPTTGQRWYKYKYFRITTYTKGKGWVDGQGHVPIHVRDIKCQLEVWVLEDGTIVDVLELADVVLGLPTLIINSLLDKDKPDDCGVTDPWPPRDNPKQPWRQTINLDLVRVYVR